jgi:IS6 family transposase
VYHLKFRCGCRCLPERDGCVKYLNNVIEQDHRFVKKKVRASQCFKSFHTAERTLEGVKAVNMMRKGQVKRLAGSDAQGQAKFVASLLQIAA